MFKKRYDIHHMRTCSQLVSLGLLDCGIGQVGHLGVLDIVLVKLTLRPQDHAQEAAQLGVSVLLVFHL